MNREILLAQAEDEIPRELLVLVSDIFEAGKHDGYYSTLIEQGSMPDSWDKACLAARKIMALRAQAARLTSPPDGEPVAQLSRERIEQFRELTLKDYGASDTRAAVNCIFDAAIAFFSAAEKSEPIAKVAKYVGGTTDPMNGLAVINWLRELPPEGSLLYTHPLPRLRCLKRRDAGQV